MKDQNITKRSYLEVSKTPIFLKNTQSFFSNENGPKNTVPASFWMCFFRFPINWTSVKQFVKKYHFFVLKFCHNNLFSIDVTETPLSHYYEAITYLSGSFKTFTHWYSTMNYKNNLIFDNLQNIKVFNVSTYWSSLFTLLSFHSLK